MRTEAFSAQALVKLLRRQKIATMSQLLDALGTRAERTVFRKLAALSYRTSYSHRGRYYTLEDVADFDARGLWSFGEAWFSICGTLVSTAEAWVQGADAGYRVDELDHALHVATKDALRHLVRDGRLTREKLRAQYLYCSGDPAVKRQQLLARRAREAAPHLGGRLPEAEVLPDELKAAIVLFFGLLDEKQRRLYAGLESLKMGHGGHREIADLFGLDVGTVARGCRELLQREVERGRVRRPGAGRKPVEKKRQRSSRESKR